MYLFIETQQSGIPKDYKASYKLSDNWPRITQFSYILADKKANIIEEASYLIYPEAKIPKIVSKITRIDNTMLKSYGRTFNKLEEEIKRLFQLSDYVIGFNINYDISLLKAELYRNDIDTAFVDSNWDLDLGIKTRDLLKLKTRVNIKYKIPKLEDIYLKLFGIALPDLNSINKLHKEKECFFKLKHMNLLGI